MKKAFYLFVNLLLISQLTTAQSVTLATSTANPTKGTVYFNNATNQLQYWDGTAWIPITNAASGTGWALNGANINNNNAGNVGIGINNPTNKLQIGSLGSSGFATNQLALGNGTGAVAIFQTDVATLIGATTDIILRPRNNGTGRVGINTMEPRGPLDVTYLTSNPALAFAYFNTITPGSYNIAYTSSSAINVSIYAANSIYAEQFASYSDARIKNIIGVSNSAKDLETIKALQITDYVMKDKIQFGNNPFKKVIAQEVEKVYPQAISRITDVVPDIYALAEKVVFDEKNKLLTVSLSGSPPAKSYDIKIGEKIEFIHEKEGKIKAEVIEVSGNSFTIKDWKYATDKIFVYGREVNDFRSVDYEAISMLGISAIQQLAKENEALKSKFTTENDLLKKQIADLTSRFEKLEAMLTNETKTTAKLNN